MSTDRLFYLSIVITFLVVTACAPIAITPAPAVTPLTPTKEPTAVPALPFTHTACAEGVDLTGQTVSLYHMLALFGEQNDTFLQPLKAGFDDATEYFNARGGICGATLAQVFADTQMSNQSIYNSVATLEPKPALVALYGSGDAEDLLQ